MGSGYDMTYITLRLRLWYTKTDCKSTPLTPTIKWNCVDKGNIYQLLRDFCDLQCGNLGQAICNRQDILWLMFITMPASKYTLFVPAVEQYKWFHAWASCVSSLSWDFSLSSRRFYCIYCFFTASCYAVHLNISHFSFLPYLTSSLPRSIPLFASFSLSSCCFSPLFLSLSHPRSHCVKPQVQMLHSVPPPFSMWSCEKPREPSRMHQPCQTPHPHNSSLWTRQQSTQTLSKNTFFCLLAHVIWHVAP